MRAGKPAFIAVNHRHLAIHEDEVKRPLRLKDTQSFLAIPCVHGLGQAGPLQKTLRNLHAARSIPRVVSSLGKDRPNLNVDGVVFSEEDPGLALALFGIGITASTA